MGLASVRVLHGIFFSLLLLFIMHLWAGVVLLGLLIFSCFVGL